MTLPATRTIQHILVFVSSDFVTTSNSPTNASRTTYIHSYVAHLPQRNKNHQSPSMAGAKRHMKHTKPFLKFRCALLTSEYSATKMKKTISSSEISWEKVMVAGSVFPKRLQFRGDMTKTILDTSLARVHFTTKTVSIYDVRVGAWLGTYDPLATAVLGYVFAVYPLPFSSAKSLVSSNHIAGLKSTVLT